VGHGVGGWGARAIADSHRGEFKAVGSIAGVTDAACFASVLARIANASPKNCGQGRLCTAHDLLEKVNAVLVPDDEWSGRRNLLTEDPQTGLLAPNEEIVRTLRGVDPHETDSVYTGYTGRANYLMYIDVGRWDEFGLHECNAALSEKFTASGLVHKYSVYLDGEACSICDAGDCVETASAKACGGHRADGPATVESSLASFAGEPLWTGSLKSRFLLFLGEAARVVYGS